MAEIEEIQIDEEIEEIERQLFKVPFPAVTLCGKNNSIYFNIPGGEFCPEYIKWGVTTEYVIGLPGDSHDPKAYRARRPSYRGEQHGGMQAKFPARLQMEKKVKSGIYRLYKYKNGFAFKRYEPILDKKYKLVKGESE